MIAAISNCQSVLIFSFMIEILLLSDLTSEVVFTVYQFLKFVESDNLLIKEIFQDCLDLFDFITSHYSNLSHCQELLQSDSSIKWRECSASSEVFSELSSWSIEEKSKLKTDQAQFLQLVKSLSSHSVYMNWLASQKSQFFETIHFFSSQSESSSAFNMTDNTDDLELWMINLKKILNIKFDALMIIMSRNQQNQQNSSCSWSSQARNSSDNSTSFIRNSILVNKQFKSEKIRYFDSELEIENDSVVMNDKKWIQNVFIFIQWIKNIVSIKKNEIIRTNLLLYLKEAVVTWYTDLLNDIEKTDLRSDLKLWYDTLKKQFQENSTVTLSKLNKLRYIW